MATKYKLVLLNREYKRFEITKELSQANLDDGIIHEDEGFKIIFVGRDLLTNDLPVVVAVSTER